MVDIYIKKEDIFLLTDKPDFIPEYTSPASHVLISERIGKLGNNNIKAITNNFLCRNCGKKLKEYVLFEPYNVKFVFSPYCSMKCMVADIL